jgi:hypothetical protein
MKFLARIEAQKSNLDSQFSKLAADIISLDYGDEEEKKLLDTLQTAYNKIKKQKAQAMLGLSIDFTVVADVNWDAVIRENKAKQQAVRQRRVKENKTAMELSGKDRKLLYPTSPKVEPMKKQIAKEVGNLVHLDFGSKREVVRDDSVYDKIKNQTQSEEGDRLSRIRTSLEKINKLMVELKRMAAENKAQKQKDTKAKPGSKPTLKAVPSGDKAKRTRKPRVKSVKPTKAG